MVYAVDGHTRGFMASFAKDFSLFKEIQPKSLSDEVFEQIKQLIFQGKLKPGDKLPPERELALQFKVGRPCLREALNRLRAIGFLDLKKQNGYYVRSASDEMVGPLKDLIESEMSNLIDFLEFRKLLDIYCAKQAIRNASDVDIAQIEKAFTEDSSFRFHITIAEATKNMIFIHLMTDMHNLLSGISFIKTHTNNSYRIVKEQHKMILKALVDRDEAAVEKSITEHIDWYIEEAKRKIGD